MRIRLPRLAGAFLLAAAVVAAALLTPPPGARADGDPASDVLLGQDVFYPYTPPVSQALQNRLNAATAAASQAHFPVKVALIASPVDLGVIPDLFGKPQQYADFLDQEISFQTRQPLLVVMAAGYGVQGLPARARAAVPAIPKPVGTRSDALAQAAVLAVQRLSAAAGHPLSATPSKSGSGGSSSRTILLAALIAAALLTAGALVATRRRG